MRSSPSYGELGTCEAPQETLLEQRNELTARPTGANAGTDKDREQERAAQAHMRAAHRRRHGKRTSARVQLWSSRRQSAAAPPVPYVKPGGTTPAVVHGRCGRIHVRHDVAVPSSRSGGLDAAVARHHGRHRRRLRAESEGEGKDSGLAEEMPPPALPAAVRTAVAVRAATAAATSQLQRKQQRQQWHHPRSS
jgi:hypothetical protein